MHSEAAALQTLLEGVPLPASKRDLIEYARANGADARSVDLLAQLPDGEYASIDQVGEELAPVQSSPGGGPRVPREESGEPPGGTDYVNADAQPGAVRHDAPPANPPQKTLEEQAQTLEEQQQRQRQLLDS